MFIYQLTFLFKIYVPVSTCYIYFGCGLFLPSGYLKLSGVALLSLNDQDCFSIPYILDKCLCCYLLCTVEVRDAVKKCISPVNHPNTAPDPLFWDCQLLYTSSENYFKLCSIWLYETLNVVFLIQAIFCIKQQQNM